MKLKWDIKVRVGWAWDTYENSNNFTEILFLYLNFLPGLMFMLVNTYISLKLNKNTPNSTWAPYTKESFWLVEHAISRNFVGSNYFFKKRSLFSRWLNTFWWNSSSQLPNKQTPGSISKKELSSFHLNSSKKCCCCCLIWIIITLDSNHTLPCLCL